MKIDRMQRVLKKMEGMPVRPPEEYGKYFDMVYYHEGQEDEMFLYGIEKSDVIDQEISLCGYFVIITSERMTAREAISLYKSRDSSEKLFRGDKSYLGNKSLRVPSQQAADAKIFIEFVALIVRNRMYTCLKDAMAEMDEKPNYMTVPAAIRELEKLEMAKMFMRTDNLSFKEAQEKVEQVVAAFDRISKMPPPEPLTEEKMAEYRKTHPQVKAVPRSPDEPYQPPKMESRVQVTLKDGTKYWVPMSRVKQLETEGKLAPSSHKLASEKDN